MRLVPLAIVIAALGLAGCAQSGGLQTNLTGVQPKPKVVLVSDFTFASEVVAIDRGYTARLERKIGIYPAYERRQRTAERVNDEIVATIIATLREAGLDAQTGGEDTLTLEQSALVVSGKLRPSEPVTDKNKNSFGFGAGRGHVVAAISASLFSAGGRREVLTFNAEAAAGKREPAVPPKIAAARNAAIAAVIAATGGTTERLSPDVEGPARRLGRAIGDRVLAFAKEQGWLEKTEALEPAAVQALPPKKPEKKSDNRPDQPDDEPGQPKT